ncbi:MAG: type II secretion system F family protein [Candidatus Riflebacteria bacterium]|nr:type II secretion system F family protein [Candidatus Riflebacteria bacterium]
MPLYSYKGYNSAGAISEGSVEATEIDSARRKIRDSGILPFEISQIQSNSGSGTAFLGTSDGLSMTEKARFSRQLSVFLKGGVPLVKALSGMMNQEAWAHKKILLAALKEGIERGKTISAVIEENPSILDSWSNSIVRVGETSGRLEVAFAELSSHFSKVLEYRRRLTNAAIYPVIMMILASGVLTFLMVYLLPMIQKIFSDMQGRLPWITRFLLSVSDFMRNYGLITTGICFAVVVILHFFLKSESVRKEAEYYVSSVPFIGKLILSFQLEAWVRNMSLMVKSGIPLLEAIKTSRSSSVSLMEKAKLEKVEASLIRGMSFSGALTASNSFPAFLIQMVEAGEASGDLAGMLEIVAADLESESIAMLEILMNLFEPVLIIGIGIVVGGIMIGVLLPIYEMNKIL